MSKRTWPTPVAQDFKNRGPNSKQQGLSDVVRMWPTPVASDRKGGVSDDAWNAYTDDKKKERLSSLKNAVLFPTPGATGLSNGSGNCERANELYEQGVITDEERRSFRAGNGGQLNPDWVEVYLMAWPPGWTRLEPINKELYYEWERLFRAAVISSERTETSTENVQESDAEMRDMRNRSRSDDSSQRSQPIKQQQGQYTDSMQEMSRTSAWVGEVCKRGQSESVPNMREGVCQKSEQGEILQSALRTDSELEKKRSEGSKNMSGVWKGFHSSEIASERMLSFMREQASMAEQIAEELRREFKRWNEIGIKTLAARYWMPDPAEIGLIPRVTNEKEYRRERLETLGNGQVPSCVCLAESILREVVA